jgi:hypothetical protein
MTPVDIHAELDCELDSAPISIRSSGRKIVVEVPDVGTGIKLFHVGLPRGSRLKRLHSLKNRLDQLLAIVEVRIANQTVLLIGHEVGSPVWNFFGLPRLHLNAISMIRAWSATNSPD